MKIGEKKEQKKKGKKKEKRTKPAGQQAGRQAGKPAGNCSMARHQQVRVIDSSDCGSVLRAPHWGGIHRYFLGPLCGAGSM